MSTRTVSGKLEELIEQISWLEDVGGKIQVDEESAALATAAKLSEVYLTWYASALNLLPDDLKERFRSEYEGGFARFRIKHFLNQPRQLSQFYASLDEKAVKVLDASPWQHPFNRTFRGPLTAQKRILLEARARHGFSSDMLEGLQLLEQISRRLPISFAVLRREIQQRRGLDVTDEYDVQRILHAVTVLLFEEVENEEPTPKKAGASSRLDFLIRRERIAIETKMVGKNLSVKNLRCDLADDIIYFRAHPDAGSLFIFVYDPFRKIINASGFEGDLYSDSDEFPVRVVVAS